MYDRAQFVGGPEIANFTGRGCKMKKLSIGLLLMSGFLMAQDQQPVQQESQHLTESQRLALGSQSPRVRVHSKRHANKDTDYYVTENKTTIVAMVPYGK